MGLFEELYLCFVLQGRGTPEEASLSLGREKLVAAVNFVVYIPV